MHQLRLKHGRLFVARGTALQNSTAAFFGQLLSLEIT